MLAVPTPGQDEATATDHRSEHQSEGCGHPVIDRRDRDDVHVRRGDTRCGKGDGTDTSAGARVQAGRDDDERPGEHCACADADFGTQDAGLGGEHEQQDDADECDCDACDGENLADPIRVARWPGLSRRCRRWRHPRRRGHGRRGRRRRWWRVRRGGRHMGLRNVHGRRHRMRCGLRHVRALAQQAVQLGQVGRNLRELRGHRGEVRREPGNDGVMRCGHCAIVATDGCPADE